MQIMKNNKTKTLPQNVKNNKEELILFSTTIFRLWLFDVHIHMRKSLLLMIYIL